MTANAVKTLVTVHPTLLKALFTFFLMHGQYFGRRARGLERRHTERREAIREMRTEQAREHLDLYLGALQKLTRAERSLGKSRRKSHQTRSLEEVLSLLDVAGRTGDRIDALDDPELAKLNGELRRAAGQLGDRIAELAGMLRNNEQLDQNAISQRTSAGRLSVMACINEMRVRLDGLA